MSLPPHYCPHCGYNLQADKPLEFGPWHLTAELISFNGFNLKLSKTEASIVYTIAAGKGRPISIATIAARTSESENLNNITVLVHRARRKSNDTLPIETVHGRGYRWCA